MVNEIRASLPQPKPFVWEREYGPLWTGSDCTAFWLAPEPDDILTIDGIRATLRDHQSGEAKRREQVASAMNVPPSELMHMYRQQSMAAQNQLSNMQHSNMQHSNLYLYGQLFDPLAMIGIGLPTRKGTRQ